MTTTAATPVVAIFDQFLDAFARIPRAQQKKVHAFVRKFRADPTTHAINYEKIRDFADPNLRTVRIDDAWRAIVLKPDKGNTHVLLWVDHHDEAMAWARNKRCTVHPATGSLQVLTLDPSSGTVPTPKEVIAEAPGLFAPFDDEALVGLGVPAELVALVRAVGTSADLEETRPHLPPEAFEALWFLGDGEPLEDVREALGLDTAKPVAVDDFQAALETDVTRRRFMVVADDEELAAMLDAPLERWRVFLHPAQRKLVEREWNGPVRVLGGAGTGKTVVAMHRAAWLAQNAFTNDDDRLLFTTFTHNLAEDIKGNLASLCASTVLRRIEVVHLDKWVAGFLRGLGYSYTIEYWKQGEGVLWDEWQDALRMMPATLQVDPSFYREEWEYVVQPAGCDTIDAYVAASRAGRGVRLSRPQRKAAWAVFDAYRRGLERQRVRESVDAMRDAMGLIDAGRPAPAYRAVLVDEAQDMSTAAFALIRRLVERGRNDLFIVGDGHQRIYRRKVVLSRAGIEIRGRSRRLRINYRTTEEIRRAAVAVLDGVAVDDLDEGRDTTKGTRSLLHGVSPTIQGTAGFAEEVTAIADFVAQGEPERTCLVARTNRLVGAYQAALRERGLATYQLPRDKPEDRSKSGLRCATMHRVKGLEFDRIIVAGASSGNLPLASPFAGTVDPAVRDDLERQERALLYVALTRARSEALITYHGVESPLVRLLGRSKGSDQRPAEQ